MRDLKRVVVVDDDDGVRALLTRALRGDGYRVEAFATAEAALGPILADPPAFVLMDLSLPGRSGLELQRELRAQLHDLTPPAALVSGSLHELGDSEREEFDFCLAKPFRVAALRRIAKELGLRARLKRTASAARMTAAVLDQAADDDDEKAVS
jgi:DNA-binding response OmpR family regulator